LIVSDLLSSYSGTNSTRVPTIAMAPPLTRGRYSVLTCCTTMLPFDVWVHISTFLYFVHDACMMKQICKLFDTQFIHACLVCRIRCLTNVNVSIPPSTTFHMAHAERAWHGVRLTATRTDGAPPAHSSTLVIRSDATRVIGRYREDMHRNVSRVHLLMELASSPVQLGDGCMGFVNVLGQNGTVIDGADHRPGARVPMYLGTDIELVMNTGIHYKVAYL